MHVRLFLVSEYAPHPVLTHPVTAHLPVDEVFSVVDFRNKCIVHTHAYCVFFPPLHILAVGQWSFCLWYAAHARLLTLCVYVELKRDIVVQMRKKFHPNHQ